MTSVATGYLLVFAAGVFQGSFMLPMKFTRRWAWENTWLVFSISAYLLWPWLIVLLELPHFHTVLARTSSHSLLLLGLFGLAWGVGALTFGLGVDRLGLGLGFTVIIGLTVSAGSLIPMVVLSPDELGRPKGLLTILALVLVVIGIAVCAWAGKLRGTQRDLRGALSPSSYAVGLAFCVISGLLSSSANLGFTFGGEVIEKAIDLGAREAMAGNSVWALMTIPLFMCNATYCVWLLKRRATARLYFLPEARPYWGWGVLMGFSWIAGFVCYAPGVRRLGTLGPSVGWAIMMATMIITANLWGVIFREWKEASRSALALLFGGVGVLIVAIWVVGHAGGP